jgi:gliding motility-associated-like protein
MSSASFADLNGISVFGSAAMISSNFQMYGSLQEVAISTEQSAGYSSRAGKLSFFPPPATVADLTVVIVSSSAVRISWTAPSADISRQTGTADAYVLHYSSSAFIASDQNFSNASAYPQVWTPLAPGSAETKVLEGFNAGTTYYFSLEALNDQRLLAEVSNPAAAFALVPLAPVNFKTVRSSTSVNMTWIPPAGYQNRIPFNNRFSPAYPYEVRGYQVFRATAPAGAAWEFLAEVSSDTFNWSDPLVDGYDFYYYARAVNLAGASQPSYARDSLSGSLYFISPDNESLLEVPASGTSAFFTESADPMKTYSVEITTHPEELGGRVVKSVQFRAYRGGLQPDDSFRLLTKGVLKLYYQKTAAGIVPSAAADAKALSMYFYNGARWLQMFGSVNEAARSVQLETTLLGRYQLRTTERGGGFSADQSGLTNRLITPNGDGKNDTMVFIFDNPQEQEVKGRIYDLRGALVAKMRPGPIGNSVIWDAKAGGQAVPGGVYIYQIESQGTVYNGTVAVIR